MRLHVLYRLYPGESDKRRPPFHSKARCLRSAVRALAEVPGARLVLLVDAERLPEEYAGIVPEGTEVTYLGGIGNGRSYRAQLRLLRDLPPDDLVHLCEDDYLYTRDAFSVLVAAAAELDDADYLCLYDHPDRYTRHDDAPLPGPRHVWLAGGRHWRWVESAPMSFGGRVGTFRADAWVHARFSPRGSYRDNVVMRAFNYNDRRFWRLMQGLRPYWWKRPRRRLLSPMPALSTHMDTSFMAPLVDWAAVAESVDEP